MSGPQLPRLVNFSDSDMSTDSTDEEQGNNIITSVPYIVSYESHQSGPIPRYEPVEDHLIKQHVVPEYSARIEDYNPDVAGPSKYIDGRTNPVNINRLQSDVDQRTDSFIGNQHPSGNVRGRNNGGQKTDNRRRSGSGSRRSRSRNRSSSGGRRSDSRGRRSSSRGRSSGSRGRRSGSRGRRSVSRGRRSVSRGRRSSSRGRRSSSRGRRSSSRGRRSGSGSRRRRSSSGERSRSRGRRSGSRSRRSRSRGRRSRSGSGGGYRTRDRRRRRSRSRGRRSRHGDGGLRRRSPNRASKTLDTLERLGIQLEPPSVISARPNAPQPMALVGAGLQPGPCGPYQYRPGADADKYAQQAAKRKLLWGGKREGEGAAWKGATFSQDNDGKVSAKFKRLMGIKEGEEGGSEGGDLSKRQEELFSRMEVQYEAARQATHTQRGFGLGFGSLHAHPPYHHLDVDKY